MNDDDFNGHDHRDSSPSLPPMSQAALQGVLERTIDRQAADERDIERIDGMVRELVAGTSPWQREINTRLEHIDGGFGRLVNQMKLVTFHLQAVRYTKVAGPVLIAVFAGSFVCTLIWWIAHR